LKDPDPAKQAIAPRARILRAARELFCTRGIRCVSVDEIASAAQSNKMTLYRHFESKDLLVTEYLKSLIARARAREEEVARAHPNDAHAQLCELISRAGADLCAASLRGCPIVNAAVEFPEKGHPAREVIEDSLKQHCDRLMKLCRDAGFLEPVQLAEELLLLFEGARACANAQSELHSGPASRFKDMAYGLLKSHARRAQAT
jgi:AcrR family transcriptional regulator